MIPGHVAIILDGNRRYAAKKGIPLLKGHEEGARKIGDVLKWLRELGVSQSTLYTLSTENLRRSPGEVAALMEIIRQAVEKAKGDRRIEQEETRFRFIGRLDLLPADIRQGMEQLMKKTKDFGKFTVNFAVAYGSRDEITSAARQIAKEAAAGKLSPEQVTEESITDRLHLPDEPDLLIRPGGERRLSNFLLWQLSYTELVFLDKLWPELTKEDIEACISEYERRERRKGK